MSRVDTLDWNTLLVLGVSNGLGTCNQKSYGVCTCGKVDNAKDCS
jgi:hypothetical protein